MIKKRGVISVHKNGADLKELIDSVADLSIGDYEFLVYDKLKNRTLPQLKYLFGVVLKTISDNLPDNPPVDALYRWFEQGFAPLHTSTIEGQTFEYVDLKNENSAVLSAVIEQIIRYAHSQWGINIPKRKDLNAPEAQELYVEAYADMWKQVLQNPIKHST